MKPVRRPHRNLVETETARPRAIAVEFRHHDPFWPSEDAFVSEAMLARLRTA